MVAVAKARPGEERIAALREAVAAGERSLGEEFFEENRGHFWGITGTRPYMRALSGLAEELLEAGHLEEAIAVYERILELNPNDNQGCRDPLLGACLQAGDLKRAARLQKKYGGDYEAIFQWGLVLQRFMTDDESGALYLPPVEKAPHGAEVELRLGPCRSRRFSALLASWRLE
jgi:tetratricopeptide (TPR) repeat protein